MINHPEILRQLAADIQRERLTEADHRRMVAAARRSRFPRSLGSRIRFRKPAPASRVADEGTA